MDISMRVCAIIADVLEINVSELSGSSGPASVEKWDSIAHINSVNAMEIEFGFKFLLSDLENIRTVSDFSRFVKANT